MAQKKPLFLYEGITKQAQGRDSLGILSLEIKELTHLNNNSTIVPLTKNMCDSRTQSFTLNLPTTAQIGDNFVVVDRYSSFGSNPVTIRCGTMKINGDSSDFVIDIPDAILEFTYEGGDKGYKLDIGGVNLNLLDDSATFAITPSTASGSRQGLVVKLSGSETVKLAKADASANMPGFGVIVHDSDTSVKVRSRSGLILVTKADSDAANIQPGSSLFASLTQAGRVTNVAPEVVGYCQKIGTANKAPSSGHIECVFNPEVPISL